MTQSSTETNQIYPRLEGGIQLKDFTDAYRNSTMLCIGGAITTFTLARIAILQKDSDYREEVPMFSGDNEEGRPWQTFDNIIADDPEKSVVSPITVMTDVKLGFLSLLSGFADMANEALATEGLGSVGSLADLVHMPCLEARAARAIIAITGKMQPLLAVDPLCRDASYTEIIRKKFELALVDKNKVDPGAENIASVFLGFIKAVAWYAGTRAYEEGHFTLNWAAFLGILASMEATVPEESGTAVRDALSLVRDSVYKYKVANPPKPKKNIPKKSAFVSKVAESKAEQKTAVKPVAKPAAKPVAKPAAKQPVTKLAAKTVTTSKAAAGKVAAGKVDTTKPTTTEQTVTQAVTVSEVRVEEYAAMIAEIQS